MCHYYGLLFQGQWKSLNVARRFAKPRFIKNVYRKIKVYRNSTNPAWFCVVHHKNLHFFILAQSMKLIHKVK